ncbi:hypothetical protein HanHA300_Chr14g0526651 [Helianthus annuus]|nr:hypothetical protein HanHA300_Chr14g0526651 [Helianthus annuus]KAJ0485966.1 hypothetical protein HanHA89_Chr14g0574321 [Helianthus annuus]KAJ0656521.1 hypothetical protein HanLR1_Chr14g0536731 [Helianthus annuus]
MDVRLLLILTFLNDYGLSVYSLCDDCKLPSKGYSFWILLDGFSYRTKSKLMLYHCTLNMHLDIILMMNIMVKIYLHNTKSRLLLYQYLCFFHYVSSIYTMLQLRSPIYMNRYT